MCVYIYLYLYVGCKTSCVKANVKATKLNQIYLTRIEIQIFFKGNIMKNIISIKNSTV